MTRPAVPEDPADFSLVLGGPLFQLFRRARLSGDALELMRRRIVLLVSITWLPLLALSALEGTLLGEVAAVPFLLDVEVHVRFLLALPLLIAAELVVHRRMRSVLRQFPERNLIPAGAQGRFETAISSALRLRNSVLAECLLIAFVYGVGVLIVWRHYGVLDTSSWYARTTAAGSVLSAAGLWYGYVSLPVFQFLLIRWYFRFFIWIRLLWRVSRIDLALLPTHPDRVGGLGFLSQTAFAFMVLAMAHGTVTSGILANRILHVGATLPSFKGEIAVVAVFVQLLVFVPLLLFAPQLAAAKRAALREYGVLAQRYAREFDVKWLRGGAPAGEPLVGSADIQSLADLGNSFEIIRGMRIAPISRDAVLQLAAATLAPIAPLLLTLMPLEELLKKLFGMLF